MRALIQRTNGASLTVNGKPHAHFTGPGLVVLLGFTQGDQVEQVDYLVRRLTKLTILKKEGGAADDQVLSVIEADAPILVVSQFTLYGSVKKGRRPSWTHAASGSEAEPLYDLTIDKLKVAGVKVLSGQFGAHMEVTLTNDGPYTLWIEK